MSKSDRVLMIAGGGTGGHVLAGVAIADVWKERFGESARVVFVGAQGGIEERLVPRAGYPLELLKLGSLNRVSALRKLKTLFLLPFSVVKSIALLLKHRPEAVIGVGGYASGPLVLMAAALGRTRLVRLRSAILEQNSVPGMINRWLGRRVDLVFSAFPGTEDKFPGKKVVVCGNPVRSQMKPLPPAAREPFTIFIFGGSQGAVGMNTLVIDALPHLEAFKERIRFIHQTGEKDYDRVLAAHRTAGTHAKVEKFIHDMPQAYAQASLLICRAGSSTMSEIAAVGRAAIFVPLPTAADNHQEVNARTFGRAGAAWVVVQNQSTGEDLATIIDSAIRNPEDINRIEKRVVEFYKPNAARDIVDQLSDSAPASSRSSTNA